MLFWRPTFWMLRLTVGLAAVLPRVDVLASNGPNGASPTRDAVNLVLWGVQERPPSHAPGTAKAINEDEFLAKYPWIDIKQGGGPQLQRFGRGTRELLMAMAGGIAPDVIYMTDVDVQDFISRNFLEPLNHQLEAENILENVLQDPLAPLFTRDGQVYALPYGYGRPNKPMTLVLVYRRDVFRRVGLDPDKPPTTWEKWLDYAEQCTDQTENRAGLVIPTLERKGGMGRLGAGQFLELLFALNGVEAIRRDAGGTWRADFAQDPRALQTINFLKELVGRRVTRAGKEYRGISITSAGMVDDSIMVAQGPRAAMVIQTLGELGWHNNRGVPIKDMGVSVLPLGPSGDGFVPMTSWFAGVNATCPTEARRDAARKWIQFGQRLDLRKIYARTFIDWDWSEFMDPTDAELDPDLAGYVSDVPEQWSTTWRTQLDNARALALSPKHRQLRQDFLARPVWSLLKNPDLDAQQLLDETEHAINTELFGTLRQEVIQRRRRIATSVVAVVALVTVVGAITMLAGLAKTLRADKSRGTVFQAGRRRIYLMAAMLMIPAVGSVLLWMYLPLVRGIMIAFQDYQLVGQAKWVWLDNFIEVLTDSVFWISLWRTAQYGLLSLTLGFFAPIVLAFLLAEVPRFKITFRVLFYLPALTSGLVVMFLWKWMYDPTPSGLLNTLIMGAAGFFGFDVQPLKWLDSDKLAMISVVLPTIWAGMGPGCIIYLAALHGIPEELYEASDLDGAGVWGKTWNVAIPFMKPLIIINFLGAFIATFHTMQNIFVMTGGGPGNATYVVGLYIFYNSFIWLQFGKATAAAWILGSLLIGFTIYQLRILRELKFQAGGEAAVEKG